MRGAPTKPLYVSCVRRLLTMILTRGHIGTAVAVSMLICTSRATAGPVCDPRLKPASGRDGYAQRTEDRCEGRYEQDVENSSQLVLAALWDAPLGDAWPDQVRINWTADALGPVRIVAIALGRRDYYQMDTV